MLSKREVAERVVGGGEKNRVVTFKNMRTFDRELHGVAAEEKLEKSWLVTEKGEFVGNNGGSPSWVMS